MTLPSLGGLKHLTGDGSESTWLRHGKPVFSMQTSTPPPPSNASNSQPRLGEESGGEVFLMLTAAGNWASEKQEEGDLSTPCYRPVQGRGHLDSHRFFVVIWELQVQSDPTGHWRLIIKTKKSTLGGCVFGCQTQSRRWYWCVSVCAGGFFFLFSFFFLSFSPPPPSLLGTTQWQSSLTEMNPASPSADPPILIAIK